jgi:hypothetical protein
MTGRSGGEGGAMATDRLPLSVFAGRIAGQQSQRQPYNSAKYRPRPGGADDASTTAGTLSQPAD